MPIYEYQCDGCNEVFEVFQKVSDPPPEKHSCGSTQVHRVLSNTSFVLKGTGWYITDYARKDGGGESGGGKRKSSGSSEKAESSSPAKAESSAPASSGGGTGSGGGTSGGGTSGGGSSSP